MFKRRWASYAPVAAPWNVQKRSARAWLVSGVRKDPAALNSRTTPTRPSTTFMRRPLSGRARKGRRPMSRFWLSGILPPIQEGRDAELVKLLMAPFCRFAIGRLTAEYARELPPGHEREWLESGELSAAIDRVTQHLCQVSLDALSDSTDERLAAGNESEQPEFLIRIKALPCEADCNDPRAVRRLRGTLKSILRWWGWQCVSVLPVGEATASQTRDAETAFADAVAKRASEILDERMIETVEAVAERTAARLFALMDERIAERERIGKVRSPTPSRR